MKEVIISVIFFIFVFVTTFIIFSIIKYRLLKKKLGYSFMGVDYLVNKFYLNKAKIDINKLLNGLILIDAFIIAFTSTFICLLPLKLFWQLGFGFIILLCLIYALYEIYGRHISKKWGKKK